MSGKAARKIALTARAVADLREIWKYSCEQWGQSTAEQYIRELQAALNRLQQNPELLQQLAEFHDSFRFYRVKKHLLACDVHSESIVVLTILHASMDMPTRLAELEPLLATEIRLLHHRLRQGDSRKQ